MYLIIDNYDSFTYNLYQYLTQIYSGPVTVVRNDRITTDEIERLIAECKAVQAELKKELEK